VLLGNFIVLCGHFWRKLRALFVRIAVAVETADDAPGPADAEAGIG
jgi:hypothetical protein